ncbi:MAG: hypothetical protein ACRDWG_17105 [Actinomycetes bacterium]|jgi:hypothetical protein|nr:hypothetical protein [Actinomycetes bacterium]
MAQVDDDHSERASGKVADSLDAQLEGTGGGLVMLALAITAAFGVLGAAGIEVVAFLLS